MRRYGFAESARAGYGKQAFVLVDVLRHFGDKVGLIYKNILIFERN